MNHWTDRAACVGVDPELFAVPGMGSGWGHESHAEQRAEAAAVCAGCPVVLECRTHAVKVGDVDLFRGGMTPDERDAWALTLATA